MIRNDVGRIVGTVISEDNWESTFRALDSAGKINQRVMLDLIVYLCRRIEGMEDAQREPVNTPV